MKFGVGADVVIAANASKATAAPAMGPMDDVSEFSLKTKVQGVEED